MTNYTYPELCLLAGYTVTEAEELQKLSFNFLKHFTNQAKQ